MGFTKICPICNQKFSSLVNYMSHIKSDHSEVSPEEFVKSHEETKWSFRNNN